MIAKVNGIDLFYEKTGQGPPLVLVHGNGEDHTVFTEALTLLEDRFTCYNIDSRGHGQSSQVPELHYEDMARDVIGLLEDQNLTDVTFYGFSDGGIVGLLAAAECPRIKTLIVSGANTTPKGVKLFLRLLIRWEYFRKKDPKLALMLREPNISPEQLGRITARTLVLAGSKDVIPEPETRYIASKIPGAELRILPGEGHGSYIVHQTKIGQIIRDFTA